MNCSSPTNLFTTLDIDPAAEMSFSGRRMRDESGSKKRKKLQLNECSNWLKKFFQTRWKWIWAAFGVSILLTVSGIVFILTMITPNRSLTDDAQFLWQSAKACPSDLKCRLNLTEPLPLIVISFDGFRTDFLQRGLSPALSRFIECGTSTPYMIPSFPSRTFPNHYTIATGLYPESHGIVENTFLDNKAPERKFRMNSNTTGWFRGEPIWNTVRKNGKKSAVFYWVGSEILVQGLRPNYFRYFDEENQEDPHERVNQAIRWLEMDAEERPALIMMYFDRPDWVNHKQGPDSAELNSTLSFVDGIMGHLLNDMHERELLGCANIVVVSDHGAKNLNENSQLTAVDQILDNFSTAKQPSPPPEFDFIGGIIGHIYLKDKSRISELSERLLAANRKSNLSTAMSSQPQFYLFTKESMPARYHYSASERIGDIILEARNGGKIFRTREERDASTMKSDHGYDNLNSEMRAIFAAFGPSINVGHRIPPFQNIELYQLFATLMNLNETAPNNGTAGLLDSVLKNPQHSRSVYNSSVVEVEKCCAEVGICECAANICSFKKPSEDDRFVCEQKSSQMFLPKKFVSDKKSICSFNVCDGSSAVFDRQTSAIIFTERILTTALDDSNKFGHQTFSFLQMPLREAPKDASVDNYCKTIDALESLDVDSKKEVEISPYFAGTKSCSLLAGRVSVPREFHTNIWTKLEELLLHQFSRKYGPRVLVYSGPIFDAEEQFQSGVRKAKHIFVLLIKCDDGKWSFAEDGGKRCKNAEQTNVLPFIFPGFDRNLNNLPFKEYLLKYVARVKDIEMLSGGIDFLGFLPTQLAARLRIFMPENIWDF